MQYGELFLTNCYVINYCTGIDRILTVSNVCNCCQHLAIPCSSELVQDTKFLLSLKKINFSKLSEILMSLVVIFETVDAHCLSQKFLRYKSQIFYRPLFCEISCSIKKMSNLTTSNELLCGSRVSVKFVCIQSKKIIILYSKRINLRAACRFLLSEWQFKFCICIVVLLFIILTFAIVICSIEVLHIKV